MPVVVQRQSLEENTLHPSTEQCTRLSADTRVRQAAKSETHVGELFCLERGTRDTQPDGQTPCVNVPQNGMEKYCVATKNTVTEEKLNFKSEARDKHRAEKAAQDAQNWLEKNKLAEIDELEGQQGELAGADRVIDTPWMHQLSWHSNPCPCTPRPYHRTSASSGLTTTLSE